MTKSSLARTRALAKPRALNAETRGRIVERMRQAILSGPLPTRARVEDWFAEEVGAPLDDATFDREVERAFALMRAADTNLMAAVLEVSIERRLEALRVAAHAVRAIVPLLKETVARSAIGIAAQASIDALESFEVALAVTPPTLDEWIAAARAPGFRERVGDIERERLEMITLTAGAGAVKLRDEDERAVAMTRKGGAMVPEACAALGVPVTTVKSRRDRRSSRTQIH